MTAFHELLGPSQDFGQELIAARNFPFEFGQRIARHVDLSPELFLDFPERGREPREADGTYHEQIHIARRMLIAARDGSVDESHVNPGSNCSSSR